MVKINITYDFICLQRVSVSGIINDDNWYDYIKLLAVFARKIGYGGLVIFIDECVNLYKIPNRVSRENNYEKILSVFNDTLHFYLPNFFESSQIITAVAIAAFRLSVFPVMGM